MMITEYNLAIPLLNVFNPHGHRLVQHRVPGPNGCYRARSVGMNALHDQTLITKKLTQLQETSHQEGPE